jgi:hypothetical protein
VIVSRHVNLECDSFPSLTQPRSFSNQSSLPCRPILHSPLPAYIAHPSVSKFEIRTPNSHPPVAMAPFVLDGKLPPNPNPSTTQVRLTLTTTRLVRTCSYLLSAGAAPPGGRSRRPLPLQEYVCPAPSTPLFPISPLPLACASEIAPALIWGCAW